MEPSRRSGLRTTAGFDVVDEEPVAAVRLIGVLPHLDRPFEYAVTPETSAARPGMRVRVKFSGKDTDGIVLSRHATPSTDRPLAAVHRLVSEDVVVPPVMMDVIEEVADRCGGTVGDVLRLALPPRHARAEARDRAQEEAEAEATASPAPPPTAVPLSERAARYRGLAALVQRAGSADGPVPRAAITLDACDRWTELAAEAVAALEPGRGALLIAPDQRDVARLSAALTARGRDHAVLSSADGPEKRYRAFRRILRGADRIVIGNRSAAFAPVRDLALAICWDEGDDLLVEPRAPYPHLRTILQARSHHERCALLFLAAAPSIPVHALTRSGYLHRLDPAPLPSAQSRPRVVAMDEYLREREGPSGRSRMPQQALAVIRQGLARGPVLVQVPRSGYVPAVACDFCRTRCLCPTCSAPLALVGRSGTLQCRVCGRREDGYRCPECHRTRVRALVVGSTRTAEELRRTFPEAVLQVAGGAQGPLEDDEVEDHAIVVATPGAEPVPAEGYAAAVLLDADAMLARAAFDADIEAVRRWSNAISLVRTAEHGGEVLVVGTSTLPAIRHLVAHRSDRFLDQVLADRETLALPPASRAAEVVGAPPAVHRFLEAAELPDATSVFGPVDVEEPGVQDRSRAVVRIEASRSRALSDALRAAVAARSARKDPGALRVRLDPPGVF